jgi:hypothetical protein
MVVGARVIGSVSHYFNGRVAEAAVWNVELSDANFAELAAGVSPLLVRPDGLVFYAPLIHGKSASGGDDYDIVGGVTLTDNATVTVADHPPVFYKSTPWQVTAPAAAAAGTILPQMMQHGLYAGSAGSAA